jgi:hypothetical protein
MAPWTKAQIALRNAHLKTFYEPYFGHLTAGTPEYVKLGKTGLIWDRIYKLRNITPWKTAERTLTRQLQEIDTLRETIKLGDDIRIRSDLVSENITLSDWSFASFVSKSCEIEHNSLSVSDAMRLSRILPEITSFSSDPIRSTVEMELPSAEDLRVSLGFLPTRTQEVLELRNHSVALQATLSNKSLRRKETAETLIEDVRNLSRILLRDTALARAGCASGQYRDWPIRVTSNLYMIFPYPQEVPANMVRWSKWTTNLSDDQLVHPLLKSIWMTLYYLSVHPFYDETDDYRALSWLQEW